MKIEKVKGQLEKAYERQKNFLEAVLQDFTRSIVYLHTAPDGSSLPGLRTMLMEIKSTKFPKLSSFHTINMTWNKMLCRGDFAVLFMPHIEEEVELIMRMF